MLIIFKAILKEGYCTLCIGEIKTQLMLGPENQYTVTTSRCILVEAKDIFLSLVSQKLAFTDLMQKFFFCFKPRFYHRIIETESIFIPSIPFILFTFLRRDLSMQPMLFLNSLSSYFTLTSVHIVRSTGVWHNQLRIQTGPSSFYSL